MYPLSNQRAEYGNNGVISHKKPDFSVLLDATVHLSHTGHDAEHHGREDKQGTQCEKCRHQQNQPSTQLFFWSKQAMMPSIAGLKTTE